MARPLLLLVFLACAPTGPGSEPGSTTATDGLSSSSATVPTTRADTSANATGTLDTAGDLTTEAGSTTSDETTMTPPSPTSWTTQPGDDTTEGFVCNWDDGPDAEPFCPLAGAANADIRGTTPFGPITFTYAYFGLLGTCTDCPYASDGSLTFFGGPDGPTQPTADRLILLPGSDNILHLSLDGQEGDFYDFEHDFVVAYIDVDVPSVAETNPPLDSNVPPVLTGKLVITGGGWDVSGEFMATLCRRVDLLIPCA